MEISSVILILGLLIMLYMNTKREKLQNIIYDDIYIINLDSRKDRLNVTLKRLNDNGFNNIKRFPAVNGKQLSDIEIENIVAPHALKSVKSGVREHHHELSYGAIGCSLSHMNIWKIFNDKNEDDNAKLIVFEDDTLPSFDIKTLEEYMQDVPIDWDIVFFGGEYNNREDINENVIKLYSFYRTDAYIIRKKCIPMLLQNILPMSKQIDSWLSDLASEKKINLYAFTKNKWVPNEEVSSTDIQTPMI